MASNVNGTSVKGYTNIVLGDEKLWNAIKRKLHRRK